MRKYLVIKEEAGTRVANVDTYPDLESAQEKALKIKLSTKPDGNVRVFIAVIHYEARAITRTEFVDIADNDL